MKNAPPQRIRMFLRSGDTVRVTTGADRGKNGKITQVLASAHSIVVDGVNQRKKNVRTKRQGQKGEIIQYFAPLHSSNVMLVCPNCSKTTRIGVRRTNKERQRMCKRCKQPIDKV